MNKTNSDKPKCPICGKPLVDVIYGMPSNELFVKEKNKEVYLGGCEEIIGIKQPSYYCYHCKMGYTKDLKKYPID